MYMPPGLLAFPALLDFPALLVFPVLPETLVLREIPQWPVFEVHLDWPVLLVGQEPLRVVAHRVR